MMYSALIRPLQKGFDPFHPVIGNGYPAALTRPKDGKKISFTRVVYCRDEIPDKMINFGLYNNSCGWKI